MKKIWIDITYFLRWQRPPVGIIRVEQELIKWGISHVKAIGFFEYDQNGKFKIVEKDCLFSQKTAIVKAIESDFKKIPLFKQPRLRDFKEFIWQVALAFYRLSMSFITLDYRFRVTQKIKKILGDIQSKSNPPQPACVSGRVLQHPFNEGDIIFCPGMIWNYHEINNDILTLKKKLNIRYFAFCHDIAAIKFPHLCLTNMYPFHIYFRELGACADHLFCISNSTQRDLQQFLQDEKIQCPNTSLVTLGSEIVEVAVTQISPEINTLINDSYILFVSTIERRKNHECIYRALLYLINSGYRNLPKFVFVGLQGWGVADLINDFTLDTRVKDHIVILSYVGDGELSLLYKNALFTIYPSFYEGWGLPVAESLAYGKFVLASDTSSLPEVGGELAEYVNPYDTAEWGRRIRFYLDHPEELARKELKIRQTYQKNYWENFCASVYHKILEPVQIF